MPPSGEGPLSVEGLDGGRLRALAEVWRREGRELAVRFGGASMAPTIAPAAEVRLRCTGGAEPGRIVAFLLGGRLVVHRVVGVAGERMLTRGDANALPDPPARVADVVGQVVAVRAGDELVAPAAAPPPPAARAFESVGLALLRRSPGLAGLSIRLLWTLRRLLVLRPRAAWARLAGATRRRGAGAAGS